jgi:fluoride exporter
VPMSEESVRTMPRGAGAAPATPRRLLLGQPWDAVAAVALGGALGALARYGINLAWPTPPGTFPWATFLINVVGCALMGALMVLAVELFSAHRLVRPFAGTGILGGFTTFSTYAVDIDRLVATGAARTGLLYLLLTPVAALAAVWLAAVATRGAVRRATG